MSNVNHFEYPDLALTIDRGKVGQPSTVTLDWVVVDGECQEHDRKLLLGCEFLIDNDEVCQELTIVSVSGDQDAVSDAQKYFKCRDGSEIANDSYEDERMFDVAEALSKALMLREAVAGIDRLVLKVRP